MRQFRDASPTPTGGWVALADQDWASRVDYFFDDPARADQDRLARSSSTAAQDESREFIREPVQPTPQVEYENNPVSGASTPLTRATDGAVLLKVTKLIDMFGGGTTSVQATVANGVVTLKGKVGTYAQKTDLETRIRAIDGVTTLSDEQLSATNE